MGIRRLNKEFKLDVCNDMSLKYGTVNRDNPRVVYVSGKCWIKPLKKMDYENVISKIQDSFKKRVKSYMLDGECFDNRLIIDFDINSDKINLGEKKFLSFDFYLRQNEKAQKNLKDLKGLFSRKMNVVANELIEMFNENNFSVDKKK